MQARGLWGGLKVDTHYLLGCVGLLYVSTYTAR